jgi:molecular chaperone GrpE (heat shock protein)
MADEEKENGQEEKAPEINQAPENTPQSVNPTIDQKSGEEDILPTLKENTALLQEIKETIQSKLDYDAVKEKAFDKLYEEMRRQKEASDLLDRAVKPILSDLLLLFDTMRKYETSLLNQSISNGDLLQEFRYISDELLEILYRQEVLPIDEDTSEPFNSKIHKATKTENAESKDDDFKIMSIVRNGFTWRDKVLRPQEVVIKRFLNKV